MNAQVQKTKTLLVPTDFSINSRQAAQTAVTLARSIGARIEFLHVRDVAGYAFGGGTLAGSPEIPFVDPLTPADIEGMWQRLLFKLEGLDGVRHETRTTVGQPASAILNRAYALDCEMIVMGTTTRTGLLRWLFPDIARQVLRAAPCTVVAVDPQRAPLEPQALPRRDSLAREAREPEHRRPHGQAGWTGSDRFGLVERHRRAGGARSRRRGSARRRELVELGRSR